MPVRQTRNHLLPAAVPRVEEVLRREQRLNRLFYSALVPLAYELVHFGLKMNGMLGHASRIQGHQAT